MDTSTGRKVIAGKYELVSPAGEGGMATVWRAVMRGAAGFVRPVAVKCILPQLGANPEFVAMFVEEARVGSQLLHPNIVQVIDFGEDVRGSYFLVMEWVEGLDLGRYLSAFAARGGLAPWPLVVAIAVEALRGLSAAHERVDAMGRRAPVIHRDVTPHNILVGANGVVKLTDFGLARAMDRARMTQPDIIKGKLAYLAPEQTLGQPATERSDIFATGIVLWEALAGRLLYDARTEIEVFRAAQEAKIPPLGKTRGDLPPALVAEVERALDRDPSRRHESAREMLRGLTQVLRGLAQSADSFVVADSVTWAMKVLAAPQAGGAPPPPPPAQPAEDTPLFVLTRREDERK